MGKPRGAGDTLHSIAKAVGIEPNEDCGCKERREWLNEKISYVNLIGGCMTEEQASHYEYLNEKYFTNTKGKTEVLIKNQDDLKLIMNLYNSVHGTNVERCQGCRMNIYWERLTKVYNKLKK